MLVYVQLLSTRASQRAFGGVDAEAILVRGRRQKVHLADGRKPQPSSLGSWPARSKDTSKGHACFKRESHVCVTFFYCCGKQQADTRLTRSAFRFYIEEMGK